MDNRDAMTSERRSPNTSGQVSPISSIPVSVIRRRRREDSPDTSFSEASYRCKVCGGNSTGVHYGARSCEGCKAFFKRGMLNKVSYKCYFGNICHISPKTRGRCKACRLNKCIKEGMKFEGMRASRVQAQNANKRNKEVPQMGAGSDNNTQDHPIGSSSAHLWSIREQPERTEYPNPNGPEQPERVIHSDVYRNAGSGTVVLSRAQSEIIKSSFAGPSEQSFRTTQSCNTIFRGYFAAPQPQRKESTHAELKYLLDFALKTKDPSPGALLHVQESSSVSTIIPHYCSILKNTSHCLQETVKSVTYALTEAYREQIELWSLFMERSQHSSTAEFATDSAETILGALRIDVVDDVRRLQNFSQLLPGFSQLSTAEQHRRISIRNLLAWFIHRSPYVKDQEVYYLAGNADRKVHYGKYWIKKLMEPEFAEFILGILQELKTLQLTLVQTYLLLAVCLFEPGFCYVENITFLKFLHSHYLDALLWTFGTDSERLSALRDVLKKCRSIDVLQVRYVASLDVSKAPVRPSNGLPYSLLVRQSSFLEDDIVLDDTLL
ncbi:hypothetical protein RvY_05585 [Ramazzottius varieornatus]|uniref:Nuclear receptor domain-containing protein n=1 Tax=Ramazzottius varieornatus TaxID=947166 RepID=A0A1D1V281_RAMVA|nr:hypothetical protein RvY_05585 [Ramazzottius varieornatus]